MATTVPAGRWVRDGALAGSGTSVRVVAVTGPGAAAWGLSEVTAVPHPAAIPTMAAVAAVAVAVAAERIGFSCRNLSTFQIVGPGRGPAACRARGGKEPVR
jgi:hypothetical protein